MAAHKAVSDLGEAIIGLPRQSKKPPIVALHNNMNDGDLTVHNFLERQKFSKDAEVTHVNEASDPDDFFLVTSREVLDLLRAQEFNVVLQKVGAPDDGSLSIFCQRNNISYVNVEAEHDHLDTQSMMIRELLKTIRQEP